MGMIVGALDLHRRLLLYWELVKQRQLILLLYDRVSRLCRETGRGGGGVRNGTKTKYTG